MWRRDPPLLLRVGRDHLSLWQGRATALTPLAKQAVDGFSAEDAKPLREALQALWAQAEPKSQRRVDVIVESAWLPVLLLATGRDPWRGAQIDALARHRFVDLYGPAAQTWRVHTNYLAGDEQCLAFALPPATLGAIRDACAAHQVTVNALQPALAWGWDAVWRPDPPSAGTAGWWGAWPEQDRTLLLWVRQGRLVAMNPALALDAPLDEAVRLEVQRHGLPQSEGVHGSRPVNQVVSWEAPRRGATVSAAWVWRSLCTGAAA